MTSQERDAVLRWSDLVSSADQKKFRTKKVTWAAMEDHLANLVYSDKRPLVLLAARICMETMAKNRGQYIDLLLSLGAVEKLLKLASTDHEPLKRRVFACLEVFARRFSSHERLVEDDVIQLLVQSLSRPSAASTHLSCLFALNSLCHRASTLRRALEVDGHCVVKTVMRVLTEWTVQHPNTPSAQSVSIERIKSWCTIPRQNLVLLCKLCVDVTDRTLT
ncbi:uncharacterized protein LOC106012942 [Aplysia californica]|uniref:Uncharacterized protein LOC106012942 n=1 Tax=Aplysia californica TaxID=6500 RepID=A0ABM1A8D6_APLCA|nr:uncharacterized protein LOC106012942 [Aplysia californica]